MLQMTLYSVVLPFVFSLSTWFSITESAFKFGYHLVHFTEIWTPNSE